MALTITVLAAFIIGVMYASIFEWFFHRYVMHRPVWKFDYPFEAHAKTHHRIFKADYTYHLQSEGDKRKIHMTWWNGPALIILGTVPFAVASVPFLFFSWWTGSVAIVVTGIVISAGYYAAYEYLHWCMHTPKNRLIERTRIFFRLNGHHLLHHRYMGKNFNVVFPFADVIFGTLLLRSKIKFAQARGLYVPDVQPQVIENSEK